MAIGCAVAAVLLAGCDNGGPRRSSAAERAKRQRATRSTALFDSIRAKLASLPESTPTELRPPVVVLDARSSTDGEDVLAVITRRPEDPTGPANLLVVPRRNCRFRSVAKPGDTVKFYALLDADTRRRLEETGDVDIATFESIDLTVAQVLGEGTLLIEGGFAQPTETPLKIEVWRTLDDRMEEIRREWTAYARRRDPPLAWHPSPDEGALDQLTEWLNQWLRQSRLSGSDAAEPTGENPWAAPAVLSDLPAELRDDSAVSPYLASDELLRGSFRAYETRMIQGAQWRRDVARGARGDNRQPIAQAKALFDWVVRNVVLEAPDPAAPPHWPWEAMLHGRGTLSDRAWLTVGLLRQRKLPAAVVTVPAGEDERHLLGVVDGDQLRLFDPELGLPIPGAEPGVVASFADVLADDGLVRALDLPGSPYPLSAEGFAEARVNVVATPFELTRRAAALEDKLVGDDAVVLAVDAAAEMARLEGLQGVGVVTLWGTPWRILEAKLTAGKATRAQAVREFLPLAWRPKLWKARTLHFRGERDDPDAARDIAEEPKNDHREARTLYMDRSVRPRDQRLARVGPEKRGIYASARAMATLWLANLAYDDGAPKVSLRWIDLPVWDLVDEPDFEFALRYARARALESAGELTEAADLLDASIGPQSHGDRLRAQQLRGQIEAEASAEANFDEDDAS